MALRSCRGTSNSNSTTASSSNSIIRSSPGGRIFRMADRDPANKLTHLDETGKAKMVDVGGKPITAREAVAEGFISIQPATLRAITAGDVPKGEVLNTARIAAIMAAKRCGQLIPLCHPLPIESVGVDFELPPSAVDDSIPVRI